VSVVFFNSVRDILVNILMEDGVSDHLVSEQTLHLGDAVQAASGRPHKTDEVDVPHFLGHDSHETVPTDIMVFVPKKPFTHHDFGKVGGFTVSVDDVVISERPTLPPNGAMISVNDGSLLGP
jgi:hypothetical protein